MRISVHMYTGRDHRDWQRAVECILGRIGIAFFIEMGGFLTIYVPEFDPNTTGLEVRLPRGYTLPGLSPQGIIEWFKKNPQFAGQTPPQWVIVSGHPPMKFV